MNIGIIGTGNIGFGLAKRWANAGHAVILGSRSPEKAIRLAESIGMMATGASVQDAAQFGSVVLLAVPWTAVPDALSAAGPLCGRVLIDCTNPFTPDNLSLLVGHSTSGAEEIAKKARGATVVKAFNHLNAQLIKDGPDLSKQRPSVFICGDICSAKGTVAQLIQDIGLEPVDSGPLQNARYIEPLAQLCFQLAYVQGLGADIALTLSQRRALPIEQIPTSRQENAHLN